MRMISLRVDSSIVFTLHRHVGAERCHGSGVTGQPFKTWLKDAPVLWRDSRPALMGQPYFHAGELPQQPSELFEDPVAGRTQPWIVGWQIHLLCRSNNSATSARLIPSPRPRPCTTQPPSIPRVRPPARFNP